MLPTANTASSLSWNCDESFLEIEQKWRVEKKYLAKIIPITTQSIFHFLLRFCHTFTSSRERLPSSIVSFPSVCHFQDEERKKSLKAWSCDLLYSLRRVNQHCFKSWTMGVEERQMTRWVWQRSQSDCRFFTSNNYIFSFSHSASTRTQILHSAFFFWRILCISILHGEAEKNEINLFVS